MNHQELERLSVITRCVAKDITQHQAAKIIGISTRQIRRLSKRFKADGAQGLVSRRRARVPNNKISDTVRTKAIGLVREHYSDFGPTLAHEYLTEQHQLAFSVETLRTWMIADGLWKPNRHRASIHQSRARRDCYGELVQIDGSPHAWFEERGKSCTLIVFIDDATGKLMQCHFSPTETTEAYMTVLSGYLDEHGKPLALYSDRHSIFSVNSKGSEHKRTQFGRALEAFDIELILAQTPQAKGRVERANKTLQDRLVKAMRLKGISTIEQANEFLPEFIEDFNKRFGKQPRSPDNIHRAVTQDAQERRAILSVQTSRKLTKNLTISYKGIEYQLTGYGKGYRLRHKAVMVCEHFDGTVSLHCDGQELSYKRFDKGAKAPQQVTEKELDNKLQELKQHKISKQKYKPKPNHPWRQYQLSQPTTAT